MAVFTTEGFYEEIEIYGEPNRDHPQRG